MEVKDGGILAACAVSFFNNLLVIDVSHTHSDALQTDSYANVGILRVTLNRSYMCCRSEAVNDKMGGIKNLTPSSYAFALELRC